MESEWKWQRSTFRVHAPTQTRACVQSDKNRWAEKNNFPNHWKGLIAEYEERLCIKAQRHVQSTAYKSLHTRVATDFVQHNANWVMMVFFVVVVVGDVLSHFAI